jgi:uncharacterized protein
MKQAIRRQQPLPGSRPDAPAWPAVSLETKVAFLGSAGTYGRGGTMVACRETHMSWVFFNGDEVYKLKKPVRFSYLDFSTLERLCVPKT